MAFAVLLFAEVRICEVVPAVEDAPSAMVSELRRGDQAAVHQTILRRLQNKYSSRQD
jgi:hypothetical protein